MKRALIFITGLISFQVAGQSTEGFDFPPEVIDPPAYGIDWQVNALNWPWGGGNTLIHEGSNSFEVHQDANVVFKSAGPATFGRTVS